MKKHENKIHRTKSTGGNKLTVTLIAATAIILVWMLIGNFIYTERRQRLEATKYQLNKAAERDAAIVYNLFDGYINTLRCIAMYLNVFDDLTSAQTIGLLGKMAGAFEFERLSIDLPEGTSYTTDGLVLNITQDVFLKSIKSGQIFITDLTNSNIDGSPTVYIQVPIYKDGSPAASLGCGLNREHLNNLLKTLLSEEGKYSYIIDEHGEYVAFDGDSRFLSENNFLSEILDMHTYGKGFSKELIIEAFANAEAGYTEYSFEGGEFEGEAFDRYGYYSPVGINKWMIMSVMSKNAIDADTNRFLISALALAAQILFIFSALAFFAYREQQKARKTAQLDEQCFRILAEHTGKVVMEWDYSKRIMYFPNYKNITGRSLLNNEGLRTSDEAINAGEVHPDDNDIYRKMFSDIADGKSVENLRLRFRTAGEEYQYCSLSSTVIYGKKGKPYKSIGFIENIDELVRKEEHLQQEANTDALTKIHNRRSFLEYMDIIWKQSRRLNIPLSALMIDVDYFKKYNDSMGHLEGDKVLIAIAQCMKKQLKRDTDFIARYGGEEFVCLLPYIEKEDALNFAKEMVQSVENMKIQHPMNESSKYVTISAGMASIVPDEHNSSTQLLEEADKALYTAKHSGRNRVVTS